MRADLNVKRELIAEEVRRDPKASHRAIQGRLALRGVSVSHVYVGKVKHEVLDGEKPPTPEEERIVRLATVDEHPLEARVAWLEESLSVTQGALDEYRRRVQDLRTVVMRLLGMKEYARYAAGLTNGHGEAD